MPNHKSGRGTLQQIDLLKSDGALMMQYLYTIINTDTQKLISITHGIHIFPSDFPLPMSPKLNLNWLNN